MTVFAIALFVLVYFALGDRRRVQTPAKSRGIAPQAKPFTEDLLERQRQKILLPGPDHWCRCCGRETAPPWMWCDDCLFHVAMNNKPPHERTWYAQHGTLCPFLDLPGGSWVRTEPRRDVIPEGLGPTIMRRPHSVVSPSAQWSAADRALWDECSRGITA